MAIDAVGLGDPRAVRMPEWLRSVRTVSVWALSSAVVGLLVGALIEVGIALAGGRQDWWFIQQSVLFAEAIGLSALVSIRYGFRGMDQLTPLARYGVVMITLLGGVLVATAASWWQRPTLPFATGTIGPFIGLVLVNAVLAVVVGIALIAWDTMRRSLGRALEELREKEKIEREMALAREVQLDLLPDGPPKSADGLDVAFCCRPAAEVGGDTLDFVSLPEDRLGIAVGDVVGKGMAAALLMANLQSLVRALALREPDPSRLNAVLSSAIADRTSSGRFVTFAYVSLDPRSGELSYSLAGHHPPMIAGAAGIRSLEAGGLPLGILQGTTYSGGVDRLEPGETLVLFTDGVVEAPPAVTSREGAHADEDEEFGRERLGRLVETHHASGSKPLLEAILGEMNDYCGAMPQSDDTTVVIVRRPAERSGLAEAS